jgi:hypothetical protein
MKKIIVTLLLIVCSIISIGQSVTAPDAKEFTINTAGQNASGFSLNGFNSTSTLLCAIGLPTAPAGTTFNLTTVTGLTPATGYTMTGNKTRLAFTGTQANINNALATLKINTTATAGNIQISVSSTINPTGFFYNPTNGHFYRPISTGATYPNAKLLSSQQTFKGQQGYLVTITSADEDAFIFNNVPQGNIWFALTDEVVEAQWRIDAGPEAGTLIKTSNGQLNGNIQGQYNNWAGGEPNNSGNEDYAVTKWGGGSQWNDLPAHFSCAYVIEFGTWTNPDDQTFTEFYNNSVIHSNGVNTSLRANFNFNFGGVIDETRFLGSLSKRNDTSSTWTGNTFKVLNGLGRVTLTEQLDTARILNPQKYKATITPGQVEWSYTNPNASWLNGNSRLLIDMRQVNVDPTKITNTKIFDAYDGPITYTSHDANGWAIYTVPSPLVKITDGTSTSNSYIRNVNGWNTDYAFQSTISISQLAEYKQHKFQFQQYDSVQLRTLYNSIVTVSDVYLAFKELANGGIFGNQTGNEFTYGIQYKNADVNDDNAFDESDCFALLQNLTGAKNIVNSYTLDNTMKVILDTTYGTIGKSNWQQFPSYLGKDYNFNLTDGIINYTYNLAVTWKGDVNLSHSATPPSNGLTTMAVGLMNTPTSNEINASIVTEISDKIYAYITLDPLQQEVVGTQFQLNYDNSILKFEGIEYKTKGSPMNYNTNKGNYINLGSLISDGSTALDNTTEYKITFTSTTKLDNILGLISIGATDAVNKAGVQLKVKVK